MRRLLLAAALAACSGPPAAQAPPPPPPVPTAAAIPACPPSRAIDSLGTMLDRARTDQHEQRVLVSLARQQMERYARSIQAECPKPCRDQRQFLLNWTRRAFLGTTPPDRTP